MTKLLLSLHVLAAVVAIGPVTVAASMFPKALRAAHSDPEDREAYTTLRMLHRICRVYAAVGIAVPLFGFATAGSLGVLGSGWLIASIILTAGAAALLALLILPAQDAALTAAQDAGQDTGQDTGHNATHDTARDVARTPGSRPPDPGSRPRSPGRLAMLTGVFNLLWATVTVLMIIRPGSTTGV